MKLQLEISDQKRTVKVEESVNLGTLIAFLSKEFPNDKWKDFTLEVSTVIQWADPIIINPPYYPYDYDPYRVRPWWITNPVVTCGDSVSDNYDYKLSDGVYCVEVN